MLAGSEVIILTNNEARKLLAACGFLVKDSSHTIFGVIEDRFLDKEHLHDAHDAAMAIIELRDMIRQTEEVPAWDN